MRSVVHNSNYLGKGPTRTRRSDMIRSRSNVGEDERAAGGGLGLCHYKLLVRIAEQLKNHSRCAGRFAIIAIGCTCKDLLQTIARESGYLGEGSERTTITIIQPTYRSLDRETGVLEVDIVAKVALTILTDLDPDIRRLYSAITIDTQSSSSIPTHQTMMTEQRTTYQHASPWDHAPPYDRHHYAHTQACSNSHWVHTRPSPSRHHPTCTTRQ
jgi:hypothetical protein